MYKALSEVKLSCIAKTIYIFMDSSDGFQDFIMTREMFFSSLFAQHGVPSLTSEEVLDDILTEPR